MQNRRKGERRARPFRLLLNGDERRITERRREHRDGIDRRMQLRRDEGSSQGVDDERRQDERREAERRSP